MKKNNYFRTFVYLGLLVSVLAISLGIPSDRSLGNSSALYVGWNGHSNIVNVLEVSNFGNDSANVNLDFFQKDGAIF